MKSGYKSPAGQELVRRFPIPSKERSRFLFESSISLSYLEYNQTTELFFHSVKCLSNISERARVQAQVPLAEIVI